MSVEDFYTDSRHVVHEWKSDAPGVGRAVAEQLDPDTLHPQAQPHQGDVVLNPIMASANGNLAEAIRLENHKMQSTIDLAKHVEECLEFGGNPNVPFAITTKKSVSLLFIGWLAVLGIAYSEASALVPMWAFLLNIPDHGGLGVIALRWLMPICLAGLIVIGAEMSARGWTQIQLSDDPPKKLRSRRKAIRLWLGLCVAAGLGAISLRVAYASGVATHLDEAPEMWVWTVVQAAFISVALLAAYVPAILQVNRQQAANRQAYHEIERNGKDALDALEAEPDVRAEQRHDMREADITAWVAMRTACENGCTDPEQKAAHRARNLADFAELNLGNREWHQLPALGGLLPPRREHNDANVVDVAEADAGIDDGIQDIDTEQPAGDRREVQPHGVDEQARQEILRDVLHPGEIDPSEIDEPEYE